MIRKRLAMKFKTDNGKTLIISLDEPKEAIEEQEIKNAMDLIVQKNIFAVKGADIVATAKAKIITTDETVHDLVV